MLFKKEVLVRTDNLGNKIATPFTILPQSFSLKQSMGKTFRKGMSGSPLASLLKTGGQSL